MARRTLIDVDKRIMEAVIEISAVKGLDKVYSSEIAKMCDISDALVYVHFKNKENLLQQTYLFVNDFVSDISENVGLAKKGTREELSFYWKKMFLFLVNNINYIKFYYNYRNRQGVSIALSKETELRYINNAKLLITDDSLNLTDNQLLLLWQHVLHSNFLYAMKVAEKSIPNDDETLTFIMQLIYGFVV